MSSRISKSCVVFFSLCLLSTAYSARAAAQSNRTPSFVSAQDSSSFSLQGKITRLEAGKFAVNTEENILFHVRYDEKTAITRSDGSAGSEKDLKNGAWVEVRGDLEESGEIAAATIKLVDKDEKK